MGQRRLSQAERRHQIIGVAKELFAKKGFRGATTRAIAEAAGVSEAIIFRHFETKEDLYDAIIQTTLDERQQLWVQDEQDGFLKSKDLRFLLQRHAEEFLARHRDDPTFVRLMMYSALEDHKFRQRFRASYRSPYQDAIRARIQAGIDAGEYRKVDPDLTARSFLWSLLQYCVNRFVARREMPDPEDDRRMIDNLVQIYLDAITTPQPRPAVPASI